MNDSLTDCKRFLFLAERRRSVPPDCKRKQERGNDNKSATRKLPFLISIYMPNKFRTKCGTNDTSWNCSTSPNPSFQKILESRNHYSTICYKKNKEQKDSPHKPRYITFSEVQNSDKYFHPTFYLTNQTATSSTSLAKQSSLSTCQLHKADNTIPIILLCTYNQNCHFIGIQILVSYNWHAHLNY